MMTRSEAIDMLRRISAYLTAGNPVWRNEPIREACKMAIEALTEKEPSAEPRWTPVTERMPIIENNIGARVLITTSWGLVKEAYYCVDHWEIDDIPYKLTSVIAWMPLPQPWKGENDE